MGYSEIIKTPHDIIILRDLWESVTSAVFADLGINPKGLRRCPKCDTILGPTDDKCPYCKFEEKILYEAVNILPSISVNLGSSLIPKESAVQKSCANNYLDIIAIFRDKSLSNDGIIIKTNPDSFEVGYLFSSVEGDKYYYPALAFNMQGTAQDLFRSTLEILGVPDPEGAVNQIKEVGQYWITKDGITKTI